MGQLRYGKRGNAVEFYGSSPGGEYLRQRQLHDELFQHACPHTASIADLQLCAIMVAIGQGMASDWSRRFNGQCRDLLWGNLRRLDGYVFRSMRWRHALNSLGFSRDVDPCDGLLFDNNERPS